MVLLKLLPDWVFYVLLLTGIAGLIINWFLAFTPFSRLYQLIIQIASFTLIAIGLFMSGAITNENVWKNKVKEMELNNAVSQTKSAEENIKIVEKIITKTKVIIQKNEDIKEFIETELVKHDDKFSPDKECAIPKEFYKALNDATEITK